MNPILLRAVLLGCCCAVMTVAAKAQPVSVPPPYERPDLWTVVQDSMIASLVDAIDTIAPNQISGSYIFKMLYDSTCRIDYLFTEPWLNGNRLTLDRWVNGRSVHADEDILSFNSRTKNFKVNAGDTVRFYREIYWIEPIRGRRDTTNFFCRDTLSYSVELVRSYDMSRLMLLDSLTVMPQVPPGNIRFYSPDNALAVVRHAIPSWIDGDSVCMRVRVRARGSGEYYFTRQDEINSRYSASALRHPALLGDLALFSKCCWNPIVLPEPEPRERLEKVLLRAAEQGIAGPDILSVRQPRTGGAEVVIHLSPAPELGPLSIVIVDAQGKGLSSPYTGIAEERREIPYSFPSSGAYIVGLVRNGTIIETTKITVGK